MTLLPYEATFPALNTRATLLTSQPEVLLPAVEFVRNQLADEFLPDGGDELDARSRIAQRIVDLLAEEFPGGFLVDLGGNPAVAGESLGGELAEFAELGPFSPAA